METSTNISTSSYKIEKQKSWIDLSEDILALIHNKLYFPDRIRFRSVCRSWRIPEDMIKCWDHQSWVFSYSWMDTTSPDTFPFECDIFDPHSKQIHTLSNSVHTKSRDLSEPTYDADVYATFQGWALLGWAGQNTTSFFMHNIFTNQLITLPGHLDTFRARATFLNDHTEIFVLCFEYDEVDPGFFTATFCLSRHKNWSRQVHFKNTRFPLDVQYMKGEGKVYLLYDNGKLERYSFEAETCELVTLGSSMEPYSNMINGLWDTRLIELDGDLMMVIDNINELFEAGEWLILKFDRSHKRWIVETSLKNTAIFINGRGTSFLATLVESTQDWRVFFEEYEGDEGDDNYVINCYSFIEKKQIKSHEYDWIKRPYGMNFIQLPCVKN